MKYDRRNCRGCGKSSTLFKCEIKKEQKEQNGIKYDELTKECISCGYQYKNYSESGKTRHWGRAKFQDLT